MPIERAHHAREPQRAAESSSCTWPPFVWVSVRGALFPGNREPVLPPRWCRQSPQNQVAEGLDLIVLTGAYHVRVTLIDTAALGGRDKRKRLKFDDTSIIKALQVEDIGHGPCSYPYPCPCPCPPPEVIISRSLSLWTLSYDSKPIVNKPQVQRVRYPWHSLS